MTGDIKKKLIDSVWSSLSAIYNTATGTKEDTEQKVNEVFETKLAAQEQVIRGRGSSFTLTKEVI